MRAGQRNLWPTHSERGLYGHLLVYERGKWSSACGVLAPGTRSAWGPHVTSHTRPGRPSPAPPSVCSWAGRGVMAAGSTGLAQRPLRRPFIRGQPLLRQSHLFPKNSRTCPTPLAFTSFHSPFWSCCCFPGPGSARHPWVPCTFAQISLVLGNGKAIPLDSKSLIWSFLWLAFDLHTCGGGTGWGVGTHSGAGQPLFSEGSELPETSRFLLC